MTSKALVVLSGGQDSTTCLYWALNQGFDEVHTITFDYGQRHRREIESAHEIARRAGATSSRVVEVGPILQGTSPLVSDAELEQYPDGDLPGGLEKTFVPMRNQLFLTIAANHAYVLGARNLITGVCQEDFGGYPDCRQVFIDALEQACNLGTFTGQDGAVDALTIHTPLMDLTKAASVNLALRLPGCYEALAYSHTAYDGQYPPTGSDHATKLRENGFEDAGVADPIWLRAACEGLGDLPRGDNYDVARAVTEEGPPGKSKTWTADKFVELVAAAHREELKL